MTSTKAAEFLNHEEVLSTLTWADKNRENHALIAQIMQRAREKKGLNHREASLLLTAGRWDEVSALAKEIKAEFYGNRIVLFAPLYLSNHCVNGCVYCPYHASNETITRKKLSQAEIEREVIALQDMGHKRLVIETGEHPVHAPIEYVLESIDTIYKIKHKNGAIRRVNVNIAATTVEDYQKLHAAGIGTYILFQETYNRFRYKELHPTGPKADYDWHVEAMDRAMQGGLDDVGIGVLFGLADYRYEFVAMLMHAEHLDVTYGVGPHTISVPRIRTADGVAPEQFGRGIDDETFARIVACIRIAAPYTGIIVSTRETEACRRAVLDVGVSQISGGSRTSVGGYERAETDNTKQFATSDNRTLGEVVQWLMEIGHIPSFCTACYKEGRTGDRFMELCKSGLIQDFCLPNALMTLQEYLLDYAADDAVALGEALIKEEMTHIPSARMVELVTEHLEKIKVGSRGFSI
ncbi:MAG: [FeFe] hydrogenase H-cluster radical SAM maturase HydG [Oscillospiraceae bacterium]|nr:[FeFe] hydrogenase H-cluster radical SAM maturase HydG [Oscillospiraceae bacterium]